MKPLQNDDIQDWLNSPKKKWSWIDPVSGKKVNAEDKKEALKLFQELHGILIRRKSIERI